MRRTTLLLVYLTVQCAALAQPASVYFDNITTDNGLSHNKINCIIQDRRGFMWFGTDDGLNRYDGKRFVTYRNSPGVKTSISGNIITDILEDKDQVLWIATADGGLTKYDYRLEPGRQFTQYKNTPGDTASIPVNILNKIVEDNYGYLWLATSGFYVLRFNKKTGEFQSPVNRGTRTVLALTLRNEEELWAGRQGGGLLQINPRTLSFSMDQRYEDLYTKTLPHVTITSLFTDRQKNTWFGSWDRNLYKYDHKLQREIVMPCGNQRGMFRQDDIISFAEDKTGLIWLGGKEAGLQVYNPVTGRFAIYQHDPARAGSLANNQVNAIYTDREGAIWIGTNQGISVSKPMQQQFRQEFLVEGTRKELTLFDFYETRSDELWIGTSDGLFIRKPGVDSFTHIPLKYKGRNLHATKFYESARGEMFVGTDFSLFKINAADYRIALLPNTDKDSVINEIIRSHIVSIVEDTLQGKPVLLAVPYGHYLAYYFWSGNKWVSRLDTSMKIVQRLKLRDNLIRKAYKSPRTGKLFIATAKRGIGIWQRGPEYFHYVLNDPKEKNGLSNNDITDMIEDQSGKLWVTTFGGGLHYFDPENQSVIHIAESNNLLEGVQLDNYGRVWMTGNGNLDRYDPRSKVYTNFQLPDAEKKAGVRGMIYKDKKGCLYLAGNNFFIRIDPTKLVEHQSPLPVYLTDFKIFNKSLSHLLNKKQISLAYNENYISIEFAAPSFTTSTPVEYQYQLAGLNNRWTDLGTENKVSFANLDGGTYRFRLRATNRPGVWYEYPQPLIIEIIPPFWKRWWFYLLGAAVIAAATYGIYRYRLNEILNRQAIRNKIAQDLHDHVGSTLSSIGVYSQVAKIYSQQQKEEQLKDALEKISETSGNMISEMSDIVWTINPRNDNMQVMIQRMESFAKPLLAAREIRLHLEYDDEILTLSLGMTQRKNFYLIFKEAINNALKYAQCKQVRVVIAMRHHWLEMTISDDGIGFDPTLMKEKLKMSLSGNGLRNMTLRAKEIKGTCEMKSAPNSGTTVKLRFPIT